MSAFEEPTVNMRNACSLKHRRQQTLMRMTNAKIMIFFLHFRLGEWAIFGISAITSSFWEGEKPTVLLLSR